MLSRLQKVLGLLDLNRLSLSSTNQMVWSKGIRLALLPKGFSQKYVIDYLETFSLVAKMNIIRVILALAMIKDWHLYQLDVKNASLNENLEDEVYMALPLEHKEQGRCCKLRKTLYGLNQSPSAWFETLRNVIREWVHTRKWRSHFIY